MCMAKSLERRLYVLDNVAAETRFMIGFTVFFVDASWIYEYRETRFYMDGER